MDKFTKINTFRVRKTMISSTFSLDQSIKGAIVNRALHVRAGTTFTVYGRAGSIFTVYAFSLPSSQASNYPCRVDPARFI